MSKSEQFITGNEDKVINWRTLKGSHNIFIEYVIRRVENLQIQILYIHFLYIVELI